MLLRLVPGLLLLREGCLDPEPEELLADLTMIRGWLSEGAHVPLGSPVFLDDTKSIRTHAVYMSISTHIAASLRLTSCRRRSTMPDWRLPVGVLRRREALRDACALDAADEGWLFDPFLLMRECDTDGSSRFMIGRLKVSTDASGISSRYNSPPRPGVNWAGDLLPGELVLAQSSATCLKMPRDILGYLSFTTFCTSGPTGEADASKVQLLATLEHNTALTPGPRRIV